MKTKRVRDTLRIILAGGLSSLCLLFALPAAGEVQLIPSEFYWGTRKEGESIEQSIKVNNNLAAPITISKASSDCGCIITSSLPLTIPASSQGELRLMVNTLGLAGRVNKQVVLTTNDSTTPEKRISLSGEVIPLVKVVPRVLNLSASDGAKGQVLELSFSSSQIKDSASLTTVAPGVEIEELKSVGLIRRFKVGINPRRRPREIVRDRLVLQAGESFVNIPLFVDAAPEVVIKPSTVSFGATKSSAGGDKPNSFKAEPLTRELIIKAGDSQLPFEIKELSSNNQALTVRYETVTPGLEYRVFITLDPRELPTDMLATVSLVTSLTDTPHLIKVHATSPPPVG